ncbi:MAG: glycine betaine ABC transporter substrate-binding protein [Acidimicrobiales bacterium]
MAALTAVALLVASCGGDPVAEGPTTTPFEPKAIINLVVNDWTASALDVALAERLIERHLGHPVVPVRVDSTTEMYEGLADGSVDAVLEIWPSAMTERDRGYFERGEVAELGSLGPVGKVGWYVPRYLVEEHPELADWQGLATPEAAALFATPETAPAGRLLGTAPDYQQFDQQLIDGLGLPFELVYSGSEAATMAELEARTSAREPVLVYWWSPTAAVAAFDLVNVSLPPRNEACAAAAEAGQPIRCDYPDDHLLKAASLELETRAPEVHRFLTAFTLTVDDQLRLLEDVERDGLTIDEAVDQWVAANEPVWRAWLEEG